ncbi:ABC transporter substrate-binding protein [Haloglycomyces albus]|uniref:ABC transporter substrate-binding protein n=1 Tax=Haloglycomyces albus TaxID=526067 RepID=UPI00046C8DA0|nr:ABC transporter substrate-binding protein [Haloglycomyces albus]
MKQRLLGGLGSAMLLFGSVACGDGGDNGDGLTIGFVQVGAESAWRTANSESVKDAAADDDRIAELKFVDGQQKQEKQLKGVRNLITQGVDAIVVAPIVETGWTDVLQEAQDNDIPVILADRGIEKEDSDLYVTRLGSDFVREGEKAGEWVLDEFADANGLNLLQLEGSVGSAPANDRAEGFFNVLDGEGFDYQLVDSQSGDFQAEDGKAVMETFLQKYDADEIDLLYAHNDEMGLGAIQAMEEAGVAPGDDIQVIIVDGSQAGFQAGVEGKLNYIVECNPAFGPQLMDVVTDVVNGEEMDKFTAVEEGVFSEDDFADEVDNRAF